MSARPRLVLLPGLGADGRLFAPQAAAFPGLELPPWIAHRPDDTLRSYAARWSGTIETQSPYVLGGFSFGGMVALECACLLPPDRRPRSVVLMAGLRSRSAVSNAFRVQRAVGGLVPRGIAKRVIAGPLARAFARRDGLNEAQSRLLVEMAKDIDMGFLLWAARACAGWEFDGRCPVPVRHVHGARDRVIPYVDAGQPGPPAELLAEGGHLITWTRAAEVNEFLGRVLDEAAVGADGAAA